jgi:two-component system, NarL family, nitrate/nitrite response regulator NarL
MPGVAVFVLADVALHRLGLARLLADDAGIEVAGVAAPGPDALASIGELVPEIVLLDVPEPARLRAARAIRAALPGPRVVAVGVPETEDEIVLCAEAGICGYVTPEASVEQLAATIASVARGELPCSARIAATLMRRVGSLASAPTLAPPLCMLTRREREVVELVAQGLSNKEIARSLAIEVTTVKTHVHHLLEKLQLRRRGELAALAHGAAGDGAAAPVRGR